MSRFFFLVLGVREGWKKKVRKVGEGGVGSVSREGEKDKEIGR